MISDKVVHSLRRSHGWTDEFIDDLTPYYMATLTHMSKGLPTPVFDVVDKIWHAHILCTRDYADFCAAQFGRFIHHEPFDEIEHTEPRAETDFFQLYGLSLRGLEDICSEAHSGSPQRQARCGPGEPPGTDVSRAEAWNALARCGVPAPAPPDSLPQCPAEVISSQQALIFARCGVPEEPPRLPLALARCGEPNTPPGAPGNARKSAYEAT